MSSDRVMGWKSPEEGLQYARHQEFSAEEGFLAIFSLFFCLRSYRERTGGVTGVCLTFMINKSTVN
jgi:hypothetical protein